MDSSHMFMLRRRWIADTRAGLEQYMRDCEVRPNHKPLGNLAQAIYHLRKAEESLFEAAAQL